MNEKIIENLKRARALLDDIPTEQLDLRVYKGTGDCGTIGCALGWLAMSPQFAHIVHLVSHERAAWYTGPVPAPAGCAVAPTLPNRGYDFSWLDAHFGPDAHNRLFNANGDGYFDSEHPEYEECPEYVRISDKELALWRIDQQIALLSGEDA